MATHVTRSTNSSPVAVKPGGSRQADIGKNVEINVIDWDKGYARFNSPVIIPDQQNWIRGDYITALSNPEPPSGAGEFITPAGTMRMLGGIDEWTNRDEIVWVKV